MNTVKWDNTQAFSEGWGLFGLMSSQFAIQRLDDPGAAVGKDGEITPLFESDAAAVAFVLDKAKMGSTYHAEALAKAGTV